MFGIAPFSSAPFSSSPSGGYPVKSVGISSSFAFGAPALSATIPDVTAPTLSSPTGSATSSSEASGSVVTDEGNGTLYYYISTNPTETVATVKASGLTQAVSSTGTKNVSFTGLTSSTTYYIHFVHQDAAGNDSTRVSSSSFATYGKLAFQTPGLEFGKRTGSGISTFALDSGANYRYTVHADGLALGGALYTSGVQTLDGTGRLPNLESSTVTAGTTYRIFAIRQSDGEACTFRMVAS